MFAAITTMASSEYVPVASFGSTEGQSVNDAVFSFIMRVVMFFTIYGIVRAVLDMQNLVKWILERVHAPTIIPVLHMPNMIHQEIPTIPAMPGTSAEAPPVPRPEGLLQWGPTAAEPATAAREPATAAPEPAPTAPEPAPAAPEPAPAADAAGGEAASATGGARKAKGQQRSFKSQVDQLAASKKIAEICAIKTRQLQLEDWPLDSTDVACDCGAPMVPRICHDRDNAIPFYGCPHFPWCRHTKSFESVHGYIKVLHMLEQAIASYEAR